MEIVWGDTEAVALGMGQVMSRDGKVWGSQERGMRSECHFQASGMERCCLAECLALLSALLSP